MLSQGSAHSATSLITGDSDFLKAAEDFEPHPRAAFPLTPSLPGAVRTAASRRQEGARRAATRSSPSGRPLGHISVSGVGSFGLGRAFHTVGWWFPSRGSVGSCLVQAAIPYSRNILRNIFKQTSSQVSLPQTQGKSFVLNHLQASAGAFLLGGPPGHLQAWLKALYGLVPLSTHMLRPQYGIWGSEGGGFLGSQVGPFLLE